MSQSGRLSKDQIFAKLALQQKLATIDQINACINMQRAQRGDGRRLRLHEVMVDEGIVTAEKAAELIQIDLEPLSCPRCELRYYYPDFDADLTYTCPKCSGVLVVERERRITGQVKRPASMAARPTDTPAPGVPPSVSTATLGAHMDSGVMPLLDANSLSTDSLVVIPAVGGPRGSDDSIDIVIPELKEDALCGSTVGGYRILKKLGQGGMGVIYKAEQVSLKRIVALKMLAQRLAADANYVERFKHEARAVAKVNHANIVQIYDVGQDGKYCFFSMEYVEGENVGGILDRLVKIPPKLALDITIQVAEALRAAHANGIVHRDIKPDNIILSKDGVAKLADLGIAKTEDLTEQFQGGTGMQIGTPYYISPEQASDPSGVDIRADIYSLGASYFHMVTGQFPYTGATPMMILMKLANDATPKAHEANSQVSYPVSRIIQKMMAKSRDERFDTPTELVAALEELKLEMTDSGKSQRRKASPTLLPREQVRIEPTSTAAGELELADDVRKPAPRAKTQSRPDLGNLSPPKRPPPPARATTNAMHRPPSLPAAGAGNQRLAIQIAIVAVILVLAAIVGNAFFGGPTRAPDPTPEPPRHDPGTKNGPSNPVATKTEAELAWEALAKLYPLGDLSDEELAGLPRRLEAFAARSDAGTMARDALSRRTEADLELANRDWRAIQRELEPLLRGTADTKDFAKAETVLEASIARLPPGHLKIGAAQKKLDDIRGQSRTRADELLLLAGRRPEAEWASALADLTAAAPRLALECRDRLGKEIEAIQKRIAMAALERRFKAREQLWTAAIPDLAQQSYDAALDKAKERAKSLEADIDLDAELAEIAALGQLWQAMRTKLDTSKGALPLQFFDETAPSRQVLNGLSSRGELMLESGLRPIIELHGDEIARLVDAAIRPAGVVGRMRCALLLLTFGQLDHAVERLDRESADPKHAEFRLRALCWHSSTLIDIDHSGPRKPEHYVPLAIVLYQIETHFKACPEYQLVRPLVVKWTEWIANAAKLPDELVDQAGIMKRFKKRLQWRQLATAVQMLCPGTPAAKRAEDLLKKAD